MTHADFIHLRVHSAYSLSEGAIKVADLAAWARRERVPALALTDRGNLFGALDFALAASGAGVQPIIGCDLAFKSERGTGRLSRPAPPDRMVLLAQNEAGYRNLMGLVSDAFLKAEPGEAPSLSLNALAGRSDGLLALVGAPDSPLGRALAEHQGAAAAAILDRLQGWFPGRLYIELQRHGLAEEAAIEPALLALADARNLPLVATNCAYFLGADMYEAHDVLLCIADAEHVASADRRRVTPEHRLKSAAEMRALFADLPEACDNTLAVARRCAYAPLGSDPMLPAFPTQDGVAAEVELERVARAGLEPRLERHVYRPEMDAAAARAAAAPYYERLATELGVIVKMNFPGYFLIVADFIRWAKDNGIPVGPGRGSGAASIVSWALGITELDPLRFGLLFERFLNLERMSMPDFDIDFCQERRDEVIAYVQNKYGADRVAQIITFGTLQARAVLHAVGRALGLPLGQIDRIAKLVPHNPAKPVTLDQAIEGEPRLQQMRDEEPEIARLFELSRKLEGLYRNASTHAAGIVITDRPLTELVPLYRDPRALMPATQFSMKFVEKAGLVKFDFLGLKTLDVLDLTVRLLRQRGVALDLEALPLDDAPSYAVMARGDATGLFQLESAGMRDVLRRLKPDRFEDIIAIVALYRPGPMENIPSYIKRKHGEEPVDYLHPLLEPVLKETYGIPIYQEQVMEMARALAGFSLGRADRLRWAMGKKVRSEMATQREGFLAGAPAKGVDAATAERIFQQMERFAEYGFNKPHAAAYALIAYQTAYLKANHPVEFLAASMTFDQGNTDKLMQFRQELGRLGIALLPPDINRSEADFAVEAGADGQPAIRYALAAMRGVGRAAMQALVVERQARGRFASLFDLADRLDPRHLNKRQMEQLAAAGALDGLNANRAQTVAALDQLIERGQRAANDRASGQTALFGGAAAAPLAQTLPKTEPWDEAERLQRERMAIGFYLSTHPLDAYGKRLERLGVVPSQDISATVKRLGGAGSVVLAGVILAKSERATRTGGRVGFVQLSDPSGVFEVSIFSEVLAQARDLLTVGRAVLVRASGRLEEEQLRLQAGSVKDLDQAVADTAPGLRIHWRDSGAGRDSAPAAFKGLHDVLKASGGKGRGRVSLVVPAAGDEVEIALAGGYAITPSLGSQIGRLAGVAQVTEL